MSLMDNSKKPKKLKKDLCELTPITVLENAHFRFNKLKEWNHQSLNNVMAHEIIHYYMCLLGNFRESHGTNFKKEMNQAIKTE